MQMKSCDPNRRQAGFTLLELVVAITLMGLVLVMLYSGLRLGLNGWDSGERRAEITDRLRLAQEVLRRQLAQSMTVYRQANNEQRERIAVFSGEPNEIEFVAPMLTQLGQGGLYRVRVGAGNGRLWMRWRPYWPDDPDVGPERESILLEGVSGLEWGYFGSDRSNGGEQSEPPRWRSEWTNPERRPSLVRLNLSVDGAPWPDLTVALVEGPLR
ncbi:MAG TPA: prepilin-type N-terminal cleavage/methylation domain-containing protein [Candidatus Competibacteraceae bacterium]|nr:prepilin-type N-terminal cleavage/methylation domain-containing protein [Candidatus Competibacteraceae bacterium]HQA25287.1 prepilin-type N-terminal cleavage/methylation domain-containing protein [Candidatus Competibacteraceae bacterium]HQD56255.1 prepilin-type N-terminal cleavage/methylation domain-containing protein [Candidatus Competibacteraceae bacterium]